MPDNVEVEAIGGTIYLLYTLDPRMFVRFGDRPQWAHDPVFDVGLTLRCSLSCLSSRVMGKADVSLGISANQLVNFANLCFLSAVDFIGTTGWAGRRNWEDGWPYLMCKSFEEDFGCTFVPDTFSSYMLLWNISTWGHGMDKTILVLKWTTGIEENSKICDSEAQINLFNNEPWEAKESPSIEPLVSGYPCREHPFAYRNPWNWGRFSKIEKLDPY